MASFRLKSSVIVGLFIGSILSCICQKSRGIPDLTTVIRKLIIYIQSIYRIRLFSLYEFLCNLSLILKVGVFHSGSLSFTSSCIGSIYIKGYALTITKYHQNCLDHLYSCKCQKSRGTPYLVRDIMKYTLKSFQY